MKPRRVFVTLELDTDAPLVVLRDARQWTGKGRCPQSIVMQVQANVAVRRKEAFRFFGPEGEGRPLKPKKARRKA